MKTIKQQWEGYERKVVPPEAGQAQRSETRQAFYSGALVILNSLHQIGEMPEETGISTLNALRDEVQEYILTLIADYVERLRKK